MRKEIPAACDGTWLRLVASVMVGLTCIPALAAEPLPAPAVRAGTPIARLDYCDAAEARQHWQPVYGSAPASVEAAGSRNVLKLPCTFRGNTLERGNWEWAVDLNLSACRGVELQVYCADFAPISNFTLCLQSGQGWYGLNFNPEYAGRWVRVVLDKSRAIPEGSPAGWGRISKIRFSAWRGYDADTTVYLADLAMVGADAPVVLVQPATSHRFVRGVTNILQRYELPFFAVNDAELTAELLEGRRVLVLPGDRQSLSPSAKACVEAFSGKVLSLDPSDAEWADLAGPGDKAFAAMMNRLGAAHPLLWDVVVQNAIARAGEIAGYVSAEAAVEAIRRTAAGSDRQSATEALIERAAELRRQAGALHASGKPEGALATAQQARGALIDAYCLAQSPLEGEHRAFWCHEAYGVRGMPWDESIRILAENGFTAILPNMLWGGVAYYDSDVLPVSPDVATRGNALTECLEACRKNGIECHVWKVNFYMSGRSPREFRDRMKRDGRTLVEFDGKDKDDWLCPSHPENRKLEIDSMLELATRYDVDGIHFDYIRYPGADACFCAGCRERFEHAIGRTLANWPADTRQDADVRAQWLDWRRGNITAVVAGVADRVRAARPKVKISAAVFRIWPVDRDGVGQDWKHWCDEGYLDFICPMDYTPNVPQFRTMVRHQQEWAGRVPCYPGIGLSVWPDRNDICRLIDQINTTRELKTGGFTIFNYA
ncbi:MAG: family 10 glycosylhydrolase, partial [Phycisphaerae bacterium]|nr:family 10 glycosylhydrolase [Phycisphaerae bacterium]